MASSEVEQVLSDWIQQALSPPGKLAEELDPAKWIAGQFLKWWRTQTEGVERSLEDAILTAHSIRAESGRLGGWNNPQLGEAMHELIHLNDARDELRAALGCTSDNGK